MSSADPLTPPRFSLDPGPDLREMRDWVHGFAGGHVSGPRRPNGTSARRPPGRSWRRRPRSACTRWTSSASSGWSPPASASRSRSRSCSGATPGIGAVPGRQHAGRGRGGQQRHPRSRSGEWLPQMFGGPGDVKLAAFCASEPDAGSDVGAIRTRAVYDEATDEWVLNGTKTWATNGGIADVHVVVASVDPALGSRGPGELHRAAGHAGPVARGRSSASTGSVPRTPPRSCSTMCGCRAAAWSAARTGWTSGWPGSVRAAGAASRRR